LVGFISFIFSNFHFAQKYNIFTKLPLCHKTFHKNSIPLELWGLLLFSLRSCHSATFSSRSEASKIERTAQGTVLVSSFMRHLQLGIANLPLVPQRRLLTGFARLQATLRITVFTTLPVPYRVFRLVSAMTENTSQCGNQGIAHFVSRAKGC
jgi:hypothetical protein